MNKYHKLISNTFIFALGTFSSKLLVFVLMPIYTRVLTTSEYGVVDLIVNTANFLIPVVAVCISESVVRFGLDKNYRKDNVFTIGILTILIGYIIFLLFFPVVSMIKFISEYTWLVYIYVFCSIVKNVSAQFIRARGLVKLFAFDGIMSTATVLIFSILFLVVFKFGIIGYVMAIVLSDAISAAFLFIVADLKKYLKPSTIDKEVWKSMVLYALPLIPNTVFFWITNLSDRYILTYLIGPSANGLYTAAYKIPTIIIAVSTIFMQAWQISAFSQQEKKEKEKFYSNVFRSYQSIVFLIASGIILMIIPITYILVSKNFFESWIFVPFLVISVIFSCFSSFLSTIYMSEKKNTMVMVTMFGGALINIILNFVLIPVYGALGAAFSTMISYFVVFVIRIIDTRKYLKIKINVIRFILNTVIVITQAFIIINQLRGWVIYEILLLLLMASLNLSILYRGAKNLLNLKQNK